MIPPPNKEARMQEDEDDGLDGDDSKNCDRCRFFRETIIGESGECRKFAPQPMRMRFGPRHNPNDDYAAEWPTVGSSDWCGEFEEHPHKAGNSWE
jgi:hypothetical protein